MEDNYLQSHGNLQLVLRDDGIWAAGPQKTESGMKFDYAAMIPPPLPDDLWVIYTTGVLELAGAAGLLI